MQFVHQHLRTGLRPALRPTQALFPESLELRGRKFVGHSVGFVYGFDILLYGAEGRIDVFGQHLAVHLVLLEEAGAPVAIAACSIVSVGGLVGGRWLDLPQKSPKSIMMARPGCDTA